MTGNAHSLEEMPVLVLGAGRGLRMGGPKALMQIRGRAWWAWQDERLRGYGLCPHWVVSTSVCEAMRITGGKPEHTAIADETAPMFASVLLGLASVEDLSRGVFILPVDTPAPRREHWEAIAGADKPSHPTSGGRGGHPLYLPSGWIESELGKLLTAARAGEVGADGLVLRLDRLIEGNSHRVAVDDPGVVVNMNEPADVEAWPACRDHD